MALRKLDKAEWKGTLDRMSKTLMGSRADIEVASLELGDQMAAEWMPLIGIVYEPKEDTIEIALEGANRSSLDHMIHKPREVYVDLSDGGLKCLAVVDAAGVMQMVRLRSPIMLPPPA